MVPETVVIPGSRDYWELFDGFRHTAYRLECLQRYRSVSEDGPLRSFVAGGEQPELPGKDAWTARVRAAAAAGKTMSRVHIVTEPLTDYVRFELAWSYGPNVEAGEDIRILAVPEGQWPEGQPRTDYWLFDSRVLVLFRYDGEGRQLSAGIVSDPALIAAAIRQRDAALQAAVPHAVYVRRHGSRFLRAS